jgi:hypothetical protein
MIGISFYVLMFTNYADHNSEKILVPLYEMTQSDGKKSKKPSKPNLKTVNNRKKIK